ncbi:MAG: hypothetical protein NXI12_10600 [Alphaproteobacteria bacterium]|nr:hypothetical protein [Alphaproteobacteria bacterium]
MMLIDLTAVRAAWRFLADHPGPVGFAALLYAPVFAAQSVWSAEAAVASPGAAPLAILAAIAGLAIFVVSLAAWGRLALKGEGAGLFAHRLGADEQRLGVVTLLLLVLTFTVVGTAFLALAFMIAALALINVDAEAPAPEGRIDVFAMFGPGEMTVAVIVIGAFALFSLWFFLRLALAYPATMALGRVQVLTAWPLSRGNRAAQMLTGVLLACAPGAVLLVLLNFASNALTGAWPMSAASATDGNAVSVSLAAFAVISALQGVVKIALIGAPAAVVLCHIYERAAAEDSEAAPHAA